jgi:hypothetical protein
LIVFPPNCLPDYVLPVTLPKAPTRTLTPLAAYRSSAIRLTDVDTGGVIALTFSNQTILPETKAHWNYRASEFDLATRRVTAGCDYKELGFTELWRWCSQEIRWEERPFEIPLNHRMWRMTRLKDMWFTLSNGGGAGLWRFVSLSRPNDGAPATREIGGWTLTIRHEIVGDEIIF